MLDLLYFFIARILLPDALGSKHELNCQVARASSLKVLGQPQILSAQQGFRRISEVDSVKLIPASFGIVYLAQDEQLNRPVAVKVPHATLIFKPKDAEMYLTEARTVANLDHPGIVPVHDT